MFVYIFMIFVYLFFYFILIPRLFFAIRYGASPTPYLLILLFVTCHMFLMFRGISKSKEKKRQKMSYKEYNDPNRQKRVANTPIEELRKGNVQSDSCGIEHDEPYGQRYCPFCGSKVKQEDAVCPSCHHEI